MIEILKICGTCKYCKSFDIRDDKYGTYECIKHPPQADPNHTWRSIYPKIKDDDSCGEWEQKE